MVFPKLTWHKALLHRSTESLLWAQALGSSGLKKMTESGPSVSLSPPGPFGTLRYSSFPCVLFCVGPYQSQA